MNGFRSWLILFCSLLSVSAFPKTITSTFGLNVHCQEAFVVEIKTDGLVNFPGYGNYCQASEIPPAIRTILQQIGELHQALAESLNIAPEELFVRHGGMKLILSGADEGALASQATNDFIILGVFKDWNGNPIDSGIYLHELGHFIVGNLPDTSPLAPVLNDLRMSSLGTETFGDYLAYTLLGRLSDPMDGFPRCFSDIRPIRGDESYLTMVSGELEFSQTTRRIRDCCSRTDLKQFPRFADICGKYASDLEDAPPLDPSPINPLKLKGPTFWGTGGAPSDYDPHQVGIPLNAFLLRLTQTFPELPKSYFIRAMASLTAEDQSSYQCNLPGGIPSVKVRLYPFDRIFDRVRDQLTAENQMRYGDLWEKHGMDIAMSMYAHEAMEIALVKARDSLLKLLGSPRQRLCADELSRVDYWQNHSAACEISCAKVTASEFEDALSFFFQKSL